MTEACHDIAYRQFLIVAGDQYGNTEAGEGHTHEIAWRRPEALQHRSAAWLGCSSSVDVSRASDRFYGSRENGQIEPERPCLNVFQVGSDPVKQFLLGLGLAAQTAYLRETRHAGPHPMARIIARRHHLEGFAPCTGARCVR